MDEQERLLRCYTQNIDNLEELVGLPTSFLEVERPAKRRKSSEYLQSSSGSISPTSLENPSFSQKDETQLHSSTSCVQLPPSNSTADNHPLKPKNSSSDDDISIQSSQTFLNESSQEGTSMNTKAGSEKKTPPKRSSSEIDKNFTKAVQLHGNLDRVTCTFCHAKYSFCEDLMKKFSNGELVPCERCTKIDEQREFDGKRVLGVGVLRPDIVLYNELHPHAEVIGRFAEHDLKRKPDLLLVIGTSLNIPGVKRLVKEISKAVTANSESIHRSGLAKSILINSGYPSGFSSWENIFDFFVD
ncbi:hypothetical protein BB560_004837, partial [Smittium megazygosporum]